MTLTLDLDQIRLLATLFLAEQEPTDEGVLGVIPAPLLAILDQAQTQTGAARYTVTLTPDEAAPLAAVVEQELEAAADEGDLFAMAELQSLLGQLVGDENR
jgi:hypothetical protein